ncbi:unnamed protein product [marine sediment metagenome]|uniref:Uncharacterized protein n=1 Tax=marine sediment metagenome TaxID=412755 RepID=X0YCG1_9ZZZZ
MKLYNKKGQFIVDIKLDAAGKLGDKDVIFTASDQAADIKGLLRLILIEQRQIKLHLASITDENIDEKDVKSK